MIFVTGDTHGKLDSNKILKFVENHPNLTKNDYLIIAGDFGAIMDRNTLEEDLRFYKELPLTILFVDGNHENFDLLSKFKISTWKKGKVHKISDNIIHLMRGEIFEIDGLSIIAFGGANSSDLSRRTPGYDWWYQETPTYNEIRNALNHLEKYDNKVDIIVTHTVNAEEFHKRPFNYYVTKPTEANHVLSQLFDSSIEYSHWYFGHHHIDLKLNEKKTAIFNEIIRIK